MCVLFCGEPPCCPAKEEDEGFDHQKDMPADIDLYGELSVHNYPVSERAPQSRSARARSSPRAY